MPSDLARSGPGKTEVRIATLLLKDMPEPAPCNTRETRSIGTEVAKPPRNEAAVVTTRPTRKSRRRPKISERRPKGTWKAAIARKYEVLTQLITRASIPKSRPIVGRATLTEATRNGRIKEVTGGIN